MSVDHWNGSTAKLLRCALRLSLRDFASTLGVSERTVGRWEAAGARLTPRPEMQRALDTLREKASPSELARFYGASPSLPLADESFVALPAGIDSLPPLGDDEEMRRRHLLSLLASTTALAAMAGDAGEDSRRALERVLSGELTGRDLDEWEQMVDAYGVEYCSASPQVMVRHLTADIAELNVVLAGQPSSSGAYRRLLRVATQLSMLVAGRVIAAGAPQAGRRWWRTTRRLSEQVADPELHALVVGRYAVSSLYCGYNPSQTLALADEVLDGPSRDLACTGKASAAAARAQCLAVLGRDAEARQALDQLRRTYDRLPDAVTAPSPSFFSHPERMLRHTESYVGTYLGHTREAARAQDTAVRLYPTDHPGISQIELHRATCLVTDGYVEEGIEHATTVLQSLPAGRRDDHWILAIAQSTVSALPDPARALPAARDLRHLLVPVSRTV